MAAKRSKVNKDKGHRKRNNSRLCTLPDRKQVMQTSVLSKGYGILYASLPDLNFDMGVFKHSRYIDRHRALRTSINRVLTLRNHSAGVKTLTFTYYSKPVDSRLLKRNLRVHSRKLFHLFGRLCDYVMSHGVNHVELSLGNMYQAGLPASVYESNSDSLKSLKLKSICSITNHLTRDFCHKHLVSLRLEKFKRFAPGDFSSCCSLKELILIDCRFQKRREGIILHAPQISTLTIKSTYEGVHYIKVSVPKLVAFYVNTRFPVDFHANHSTCPYLESATVAVVKFWRRGYYSEQWLRYLNTMMEFIHHASSVTLSWNFFKNIWLLQGQLQRQAKPLPFKNIRCLNIFPRPNKLSFGVPRRIEGTPNAVIEGTAEVLAYLMKNAPDAEINGSLLLVSFRSLVKELFIV